MKEQKFDTKSAAIKMDQKDNVATLLRDIKAGEEILVEKDLTVIAAVDISFGHKLAIKKIEQGNPVFKYGEIIGLATTTIKVGEHVHVHNIEGVRGRGDKQINKEVGG